jgi:ATP-dependent DNA ligase
MLTERIDICRGISMPFYPMRPMRGGVIRNSASAEQVFRESEQQHIWVCQPKLNGDRACVAVLKNKVYIQNRHGGWYQPRVKNLTDFRKLPDGTVLDGEVYKSCFSIFDVLAINGKSIMMDTAAERTILAMHLTKFLKHVWRFPTPTREWLRKLNKNAGYDGVVLKQASSHYKISPSANACDTLWMKRTWGA